MLPSVECLSCYHCQQEEYWKSIENWWFLLFALWPVSAHSIVFLRVVWGLIIFQTYTTSSFTTIISPKTSLWPRNSPSSTFTLNEYHAPRWKRGRFCRYQSITSVYFTIGLLYRISAMTFLVRFTFYFCKMQHVIRIIAIWSVHSVVSLCLCLLTECGL